MTMPDSPAMLLHKPRALTRARAARAPAHYPVASAPRPAAEPTGRWAQGFVAFQLACQLALLVPALGPLRVPLRSAAFGASLLMLLALTPGRRPRHPAAGAAGWVLAILVCALLHPSSNTLLAGAAQLAMYAAILAPLFWVANTRVDRRDFHRVVVILWAFHTLSAGVGVLQVTFPGRFQPPLSPVVAAKGEDYVESLKINLPGGESVFRPMGLTDQPGGAAMSGLYAMLFGLGLLLVDRAWAMRLACLGAMALGLVCLYLSQVRSVLVMAGICAAAFGFVLALRGDFARLVGGLLLLALVVLGSFTWAVSLGGDAVINRLATLVSERPDDVYYSNRGFFLETTIKDDLPRYPLGAGLGRWGMMNQYFGDNADPASAAIWVEIQWTGWLLDGGVPLVIAYVAALGAAFVAAWRIALDRRFDRPTPFVAPAAGGTNDGAKNGAQPASKPGANDAAPGELGTWAALIFAYNVAAFAITFNYPLFIGQSGLEFWLLNACLFGAYAHARGERPAHPLHPLAFVRGRRRHERSGGGAPLPPPQVLTPVAVQGSAPSRPAEAQQHVTAGAADDPVVTAEFFPAQAPSNPRPAPGPATPRPPAPAPASGAAGADGGNAPPSSRVRRAKRRAQRRGSPP